MWVALCKGVGGPGRTLMTIMAGTLLFQLFRCVWSDNSGSLIERVLCYYDDGSSPLIRVVELTCKVVKINGRFFIVNTPS